MEEINPNINLFCSEEKGVVLFISLTKIFIIALTGDVSTRLVPVAIP